MLNTKTRHELLVEAGWRWSAKRGAYQEPESAKDSTWYNEPAAWLKYMAQKPEQA